MVSGNIFISNYKENIKRRILKDVPRLHTRRDAFRALPVRKKQNKNIGTRDADASLVPVRHPVRRPCVDNGHGGDRLLLSPYLL